MLTAIVTVLCFSVAGIAGDDSDAPVVVTAKTLIADNKARTVTYTGDVTVVRGGVTLTAHEVVISLVESGGGQSNPPPGSPEAMFSGKLEIDTIEAVGGVKLIQGDVTAVSERAVYNPGEETIVMAGSPRVWQGASVLTGSKIIYNIADDTIRVDDARTVLYTGDGDIPVPGSSGGGSGKK